MVHKINGATILGLGSQFVLRNKYPSLFDSTPPPPPPPPPSLSHTHHTYSSSNGAGCSDVSQLGLPSGGSCAGHGSSSGATLLPRL